MALTVKHPFVSPVVDDAVAGEVGPGEWNAEHTVTGVLDTDNFPPVPPPGYGGAAGPQGPQGEQGIPGQAANLFDYMFSLSTTEPPTGSQVRLDNASPAAATKIWAMHQTVDGIDIRVVLNLIAVNDRLTLQDRDESARLQRFTVTGTPIEKSGYTEIPVVFLNGASPLVAQRTILAVIRAGEQGPQGPQGDPGPSNLVQNAQSAAYTTVASDAGKHILHPSADTTARVFTIAANASVPYALGTTITFVNQNGAGVVTIAITSDTMRLAGAGTTGSRTLAANGVATALKITATEWIISGTGLT